MRVCVHRGECMRVYMSACVCTDVQKKVRSFLDLASYCRRFVENFPKVAKPLTELLKKYKKFEWSPECEYSFQELKRRLTSAPILVPPDFTKDFIIYCDAS